MCVCVRACVHCVRVYMCVRIKRELIPALDPVPQTQRSVGSRATAGQRHLADVRERARPVGLPHLGHRVRQGEGRSHLDVVPVRLRQNSRRLVHMRGLRSAAVSRSPLAEVNCLHIVHLWLSHPMGGVAAILLLFFVARDESFAFFHKHDTVEG